MPGEFYRLSKLLANYELWEADIAVPIQMWYNITSRGVGNSAHWCQLNVEVRLGKLSRFDPHPQPLSQFWERGANYLVPRIPSWEKGLGDEGKTPCQSRFFLKLTPMGSAVPLRVYLT